VHGGWWIEGLGGGCLMFFTFVDLCKLRSLVLISLALSLLSLARSRSELGRVDEANERIGTSSYLCNKLHSHNVF
jgi:hypothetical protein